MDVAVSDPQSLIVQPVCGEGHVPESGQVILEAVPAYPAAQVTVAVAPNVVNEAAMT